MVQFIDLGESTKGRLGRELGESLGLGLAKRQQGIDQQQQQQQQSSVLSQILGNQDMSQLDPKTQLEVAKLQQQSQAAQQKGRQQQQQEIEKQQQAAQESAILAKYQDGEKLSLEEMAQLSPTSLRTLIGQQTPMFEPTEERLEAERVSKLATNIEEAYQAAREENIRLDRMQELSDKGSLSTPLMGTALNKMGLPISILGNPDNEEYAKIEADFVRGVSKVFPGGKISDYEVRAFMKTIPSLMNTPEGRAAIIKNRRLLNEASKLKYDAYKEVLKENGGRKPRNMGLLIEEKIGSRMAEIEDEFRTGMSEQVAKFQQPIRMISPKGYEVDIPPNEIEAAYEAGARWR